MMIRALNAERSLDFYRRAFDLNITGRFAFDDFELIYLNDKPGAFEIELTVNRGRTNAYDLGDGYGRVAFVVDEIASEHAQFEREGLHQALSKRCSGMASGLPGFSLCKTPMGTKSKYCRNLDGSREDAFRCARGPYSDLATSPKADRDNCPKSPRFRHRPAARYP